MNDPGKIFLIPRSVLFASTILVATVIVDRARAEHANFKDEVFPIIQKFCVECHQPSGEGYEKRGLDMRTYEAIMKGTKWPHRLT